MKNLSIKIITVVFTFLAIQTSSVFAVDFFKDEDVIWKKDKNVFIKYARQDKTYFGSNDHPVELNTEEISKALGSLKIKGRGGKDANKDHKSVFTSEQIDLLSQNLAIGLTKAKPNQDIIFALEKHNNKILGLIKNQYFVAGRAFYKDGRLNIIIGDYDRSRDKGFEAAYDPTKVGIINYHFDFGGRPQSPRGFKETVVKVEGIENKQIKDVRRSDWLVIDLKLVTEASVLRAKMQKQEEMEKKRRELKEILGSEGTSPPAVAPIAVPVAVPATKQVTAPATRSAEERLRTLNNLKNKGLITDEEYATKRKQILEGL